MLFPDETYCVQYLAKLDAAKFNSDETNCGDGSDNESKALWDRKSTKFLLSKYQKLLPKFRNPKIKKNRLWKEMETEMKELGYPKLNAHNIDRKIRNMKSTYKRIKNNKKKTGRGREDWEFYGEMDDIFNADKSVNFEEGISSMESGQNPFHEAIDLSNNKHRFSLPNLTLSFQHFNDINKLCKFLSNYIDFVSSSYDASDHVSDSDIESSMEGPSNIMLNEYSSTSNTDTSFHNASTRDSNEDISLNRRKLCSQKNKIIELESKKINILQNMEKNQGSKDLIIKQIEEVTTALQERNKLIKERNEILEKRNKMLEMLIKSKNNTS